MKYAFFLACVHLCCWWSSGQQVNYNYGPVNVCDENANRAINQCALELRQLGVFGQQNQGEVDALTWEHIRRRSREYFTKICDAYRRFNQCIDRGNYKSICWNQEPTKAQYAVADAALEFVCGQGYYGMLNYWDCFLQAATRSDVIQCEARILQDAASTRVGNLASSSTDLRQGERACRVLQDYMSCISEPIKTQCGPESWRHVREAVQRPTNVYLPYCTLTAAVSFPSVLLTTVALVIVSWLCRIR